MSGSFPDDGLGESLRRLAALYAEAARSGWFCRFHSRLSTADRSYLEHELGITLDGDGDAPLLAVADEYRRGLTLYVFRTETDDLYEIILMPETEVTVEEMVWAANDVCSDIVQAIAYDARSV
jgi:hypothetical protein